jgi:hypothetical protein
MQLKTVIAVMAITSLSLIFGCDKDSSNSPQPINLSGTWEGSMTYSDSPNDPNVLKLMLTHANAITGTLIERLLIFIPHLSHKLLA